MLISYLSNQQLKAHLSNLPLEAQQDLFMNTEIGKNVSSTDQLVIGLSQLSANSIINAFRDSKAEPCSYLEMLKESRMIIGPITMYSLDAETMDVDAVPKVGVEFLELIDEITDRMEKDLLEAIFEKIYDNMSEAQRKEFINNLVKKYPDIERSIGGLATATGAMVLANIGGFGTYMAMSSLLSTLSFGMLGFGAYTAASSLLSIVLGPVGWATLGAVAIHQLGKPEENKMLRAVAAVAMAAQSAPRSDVSNERVAHEVEANVKIEQDEEQRDDEALRKRIQAYQKSTGLEALFRGVFAIGEGIVGEITSGIKTSKKTNIDEAAEKLRDLQKRRKWYRRIQ